MRDRNVTNAYRLRVKDMRFEIKEGNISIPIYEFSDERMKLSATASDPLTPRRPSEFCPSTARRAQKRFPSRDWCLGRASERVHWRPKGG